MTRLGVPRPAVDQLLSTAGNPSPQSPEGHAPVDTHL